MKIDRESLTEKEKNDYDSLAIALGIQTEELLSLDFYNDYIFDKSGQLKSIKYVFSKENPLTILSKIKGLDDNNTVIIPVSKLNFSS